MKRQRAIIVAVIVTFLFIVGLGLAMWMLWDANPHPSSRVAEGGKPNIIILLADDVGYADFQTYGHPSQEWTGVDRMVKEGMKFTNFYVPDSLCSPSRAALLTGRYPIRSGIVGHPRVFGPISTGGLPKREVTIAEALKDAGYTTGMVGKWHLGFNEKTSTDGVHLPYNHGFDYVGTNLPMTQTWLCDPKKYTVSQMIGCILYRNDTLVEQPINLKTLTSRLVDDTKNFIRRNKNNPFFFYLSFPQTHAALFSGPRFEGKSRRGSYGDAINEMGWAVDEVLNELIELNIQKDTLVVFLSDHGPILDGCGHGGTAGVLKGGKASIWEGGVRVPAVAWWPGTISSETISHTTVSSMDLFPTALTMAGLRNYTKDRNIVIDGREIEGVIKGKHMESPHKILFYYCSDLLMATRYTRYKIYYHANPEKVDWEAAGISKCNYSDIAKINKATHCRRLAKKQDPPLIFDVESDPGEQVNLDANLPENQLLLETVADLVITHEASIIPVQPELSKFGSFRDIVPCCNPPACSCNYNEAILLDSSHKPRPKVR